MTPIAAMQYKGVFAIYGIICAMDIEYTNIVRFMQIDSKSNINGNWTVAECNGGNCIVAKADVGKKAAGMCVGYVLDHYKGISCIISAGMAGALSPDMNIGDIVLSRLIIDYPANLAYEEITENPLFDKLKDKDCKLGAILCSNDVINDKCLKNKLYNDHKALCVEMESTGIIKECKAFNIPFVAVKIISDNADEMTLKTFFRHQQQVAERLGIFLTNAVNH